MARRRATGTVAAVGRSSARCTSCGAAMPGDAVYCPSCGAVSGALRVEPLGGDVETSSAEVALGAPRRRWLAPVVIAAVLALIVVVAVRRWRRQAGGGPATTIPATTTGRRPPRPPRSTAPTTTTTAYSAVPAAPLPEAAGVVVYISTNDGEVLRIDLGTGAVQRRLGRSSPGRAGPWMVLARQGGYAMADGSYDDQSPIYGVADGPDGASRSDRRWPTAERRRDGGPALGGGGRARRGVGLERRRGCGGARGGRGGRGRGGGGRRRVVATTDGGHDDNEGEDGGDDDRRQPPPARRAEGDLGRGLVAVGRQRLDTQRGGHGTAGRAGGAHGPAPQHRSPCTVATSAPRH